MRTALLGSHGPELTRVGFGAWAIGGPWRFGWGPVDDDESVTAIRHAIERGVNWVDTAAVYGLGHSEEVVGRALEPYAVGEDVHVFTKCGRSWYGRDDGEIVNDLRPESIRHECEQSLRRIMRSFCHGYLTQVRATPFETLNAPPCGAPQKRDAASR